VRSRAITARRTRQRALGEFLKARRGEVSPEQVGIKPSGRRRVAGLRREEVAELVGISVTWYTWLEQGRDIGTSPEVLDALSTVLGLDESNRRYLYQLAGELYSPRSAFGGMNPLIPWLDAFLPAPAYVMTWPQDLVAWNQAFARLFVDPDRLEARRRNMLWILLMTPSLQTRMADWENETLDAIARFRAARSLDLDNPRYREIVDDLLPSSDLFAAQWQRHDVHRFVSHVQILTLADGSRITMQVSQFRAPDLREQALVAYRPTDNESRRALEALLADGD
jgi:transcriptional regulator with XRE-family HTH domain